MPAPQVAFGRVRDMHPAAGAPHLVPVVLGGLRRRLGQVNDLV